MELLNSHSPFPQFILSGVVLHLASNETLRVTVCFLALHWENVLFEVANQLVTSNFMISGHKALSNGDPSAFLIF